MKFQLGIGAHHSTATVLLSVMNGSLAAADAGHSSVVAHLDLRAAFNTTDHSVLNRMSTG